VYVPLDDNTKLPFIFKVVVPSVNDVEPKSRLLNQLAVVNVATEAPVVNVRFTAVVVEPPVVPNVSVRVLAMSATVNPPGPVYVKPVTVAMFSTVVAAVVCVRFILPAEELPNAIARVPVPVELNMPVSNVTPSASVSVPAVRVYVPVVVSE
jgi:hypothetical protein